MQNLESKVGGESRIISRRQLLGYVPVPLAFALGIAAPRKVIAELQPNELYREAIADEGKRQAYLDEIVRGRTPEEVKSVIYVNNTVLEGLRKELGNFPMTGNYIVVKRLDADGIGRGTKCVVYVLSGLFKNKSMGEKLYHDELVIRNYVLRNGLAKARFSSRGIPGFEIELFYDSNKMFNLSLFNYSVALMAFKEELDGLRENPETGHRREFRFRINQIIGKASELYGNLYNPRVISGMNPEFLERLRKKLDPENLFKYRPVM